MMVGHLPRAFCVAALLLHVAQQAGSSLQVAQCYLMNEKYKIQKSSQNAFVLFTNPPPIFQTQKRELPPNIYAGATVLLCWLLFYTCC